ncbi:MAG TPA: 1-acyl-sn-glycerol-3-phosphate acyltransferase [Prolixibacteraceae bacterium]|jgi:1-acyl-sn-glycerol-3-phosphate acyltransferase
MKSFSKFLLWLTGWKAVGGVIAVPKCVVLGVPHTSLWDFVISWIYYKSVGGTPNILVNKKFFFWPVGYLLIKMGAIPVDTSRGASSIKQIVAEFKKRDVLHLAIAPEGTRKPTTHWKGGFHTIARIANIPVYLAVFDWGKKEVGVCETIELTDDMNADILRIKQWYKERGVKGKHTEKFVLGDGLD